MKVLIINGPNLNMLGKRDEKHYGDKTLEAINKMLLEKAKTLNLRLEFYQSNIEGELVTAIQNAKVDAIIINGGAYTHYSIAIRDALADKKALKIEVHLSNILAREEFRKTSVLSEVCTGIISGFAEQSYVLALEYVKSALIKGS